MPEAKSPGQSWLKNPFLPAAAIILLGLLVYAGTFNAAFHFDDMYHLVENPALQGFRRLPELMRYWPTRALAFFTFALNRQLHGLRLPGYHLVSLLLHLAAALLVRQLALLALAAPRLAGTPAARHRSAIGLFAGLIFVSHPVQTQAVTYIYQRSTLLAAALYLLALVLYLRWRLEPAGRHANRRYLGALAAGADKVRLNPGNLDDPVRLAEIIRLARRKGAAIRIGVNSGSLPGGPGEPVSGLETARLMVRTAAAYLENFETLDFHNLVVSLKSSSVPVTLAANRLFRRHFDYPLHLGVTEAGRGGPALVKSSIGIGALLADGIGETLRVSLSGPAVEEVAAGRWILQALELRNFQPELISCPTCGRCRSDLFSILDRVEDGLKRLPGYPERYAGFKVAVMGCEVNGPGEAAAADIGVACGGKRGLLFRKGRVVERPPAAGLAEALLAELSRLNPGPVKRESNGDHPIKTKPKRGGTSNRRRK